MRKARRPLLLDVMKMFLRGRLGALLVLAVLLAGLLAAYLYFRRTHGSFAGFDDPKMMVVVLESVPLRRENGEALDVMIGEEAQFKCQRVSPRAEVGKARFRFDFGDGTPPEEHPDCDIKHRFQGAPGQIVTIDTQYFVDATDGTTAEVDRYRSEARLVAAGPFFRLRGFGTPQNEAIHSLTVPHRVMPYVEAALEIAGGQEPGGGVIAGGQEPGGGAINPEVTPTRDLAVAFFVRRAGDDVVYLRVAPPKEGGQRVRAITAALKNHRDFGHYTGLAAIPEEPIEIGALEDERVLFEVCAGLFRTADLDTLLSQCCGGPAAGGAVFTNAGLRPDAVTALAYEGRLTEPLRVVRATREGEGATIVSPGTGARP